MSSAQKQIETKNAAMDVIQQVNDGKAPTNAQITKVLDKAQEALEKKAAEPRVANTEGAKLLSDFQGLIQATEQLIENKNSDETIQKIVMEGIQATQEIKEKGEKQLHKVEGEALETAEKMKEGGKQVGQSLLSAVRLLFRSADFRNYVRDLVRILQEIFLENPSAEGVKQAVQQVVQQASAAIAPATGIDTQSVVHPSTVDPKTTLATLPADAGQWQTVLSEEQKHELSHKFLAMLRKMNGNTDFKQGLQTIIDMFDELKAHAKSITDKANPIENTHLNTAFSETRKLIEEFSNYSLDKLVSVYRDIVNSISQDEKMKKFMHELRSIFRDSLEKPEQIDQFSYTQRIEKIFDTGRDILQDEKWRNKYNSLIKEGRQMLEGLKNDQDLQNVQEKAQAFLEHFTYTDAKGEKHFNTDLVSQMRQFIVPLFLAQLDQIPIATIEGSNEEYDYRIDHLVFSGREIIPDKVEIHTRSDIEFDVANMEADKASTRALLKIANINPKMHDIHYFFRKKTFPTLEDTGIANVDVQGEGITVRVLLGLHNANGVPSINVAQVRVDVDSVAVNIIQTKHEFLATIFQPIYKNRLRTMIQEAIENKIKEAFDRIETGFNSLMIKYPPSKMTAVIKDQVQQITSSTL